MTSTAIYWLLYDLMRNGATNDEISTALQARGATYEDLVRYLVEEKDG